MIFIHNEHQPGHRLFESHTKEVLLRQREGSASNMPGKKERGKREEIEGERPKNETCVPWPLVGCVFCWCCCCWYAIDDGAHRIVFATPGRTVHRTSAATVGES
jgi:hypothetical protein